jgi:hypothetical protein
LDLQSSIHKLRIVLKELSETQSWLEQIVANGLFSRGKMAAIIAENQDRGGFHQDGARLRQSNLRFRISDLRCRIRPISKSPLLSAS